MGLVWAMAAVLGIVIYFALFRGAGPTTGPPGRPDPAQVARGQVLYQASCASCHGARGEGDPNWQTRNPDGTLNAPPHDETGHTWHHPDGQLYLIVRDGGQVYATAGFQSQMPAFGALLSDQEIRDVISYLKSLWPAEQREFQADISRRDPFPG